MDGFSKIDGVYVALVFIVPGYIFLTIRNQFVAGQDRLGKEQMLAFVTYSALNFGFVGWIVYLAISYDAAPYVKAASWLLTLVFFPALFGLLCGLISQKEFVGRLYGRLGLNSVHPTPRAWEWAFFHAPARWVLVTLKSGDRFAGFFGGDSFASSDPKERDIYISEIFEFSEDVKEPWQPTGKSVLITAGEIRTIEFIPIKKEKSDDK